MGLSLITRVAILFFVCSLFFSLSQSASSSSSPSSVELSALSASSSLSVNSASFKQILLDAFKQLLAAPMKLAKMLIQEVNQILRNRDLRELFDVKVVKQLLSKAPKRLFAYYDTLIGMESHCLKRSVCDVAEFTARRIPKWLEQILFIYFNTFSATKPYYEVIVHGLTIKNCAFMYPDCNPEEFISRLRSNITQTITTTVAPLKAAIEEIAGLDTPIVATRPTIDRPLAQKQQNLKEQQQQQQPKQRPESSFDNETEPEVDEEFVSELDSEALMNDRHFREQQMHHRQQQQQQRQRERGGEEQIYYRQPSASFRMSN